MADDVERKAKEIAKQVVTTEDSCQGPSSAAKKMEPNYRIQIQRALCSIHGTWASFVHSDTVPLEELKGLPRVSLKGIGQLSLPLRVEQAGKRKICLYT